MSFLVLAYLAAGAFLLWRTSKMEAEIDDLIARVRSLEAQPRPVAPSVSPDAADTAHSETDGDAGRARSRDAATGAAGLAASGGRTGDRARIRVD